MSWEYDYTDEPGVTEPQPEGHEECWGIHPGDADGPYDCDGKPI